MIHGIKGKAKERTWDLVVAATVGLLLMPALGSFVMSGIHTDAPEASTPARVRLSYVNSDTKTRIAVTWETSSTSNPKTVQYGLTTSLGSTATGVSRTLWRTDIAHTAELTGLTAGTKYYYRVSGDSGEWSSIYNFTTSPASGTNTVAFIGGDSRDNPTGMTSVLNSMLRQPEVGLTLFNGDYEAAYGNAATMRGWFDRMSTWGAKGSWMGVMGNHEEDYAAADYLHFLDDFDFIKVNADESAEHFYSFDYGQIHFINLNTEADERNYIPTTIQAKQNAWLAADLAAADANRANVPWIVVTAHQPMYAAGGSHGPPSGGNCVATWLPLFDQYNVNLYVNGHNHMYQRTYPVRAGARTTTSVSKYTSTTTGTIYATIGKMGTSSTYTPSTGTLFVPYNNNIICYGRLDVIASNGTLRYRLLNPTNEAVLDQFYWERAAPPTTQAWFNATVNTTGWNLVSLNVTPGGAVSVPWMFTDQVNGGAGLVQWDRMMWYDPRTPTHPWKQYNKNWGTTLQDLAAYNWTRGVWLNVTSVGDGLICKGGTNWTYQSASGVAIPLKAGWNLVGYPAKNDAAYTVGQLKAATGAALVEGFNPAVTYRTSQLADATVMKKGRAYWVRVASDVVWTVNW